MSSEDNANDVFEDTGQSHEDSISQYESEFSGTETDVEGVTMPGADEPYFELLTWLVARADADTLKFGDPNDYTGSDSTVAVLHQAGSGNYQITRVAGDGTQTILADEEAAELGRRLDIDNSGDSFELVFEGEDKTSNVSFSTQNGFEINLNHTEQTSLSVVEGASDISIEYNSEDLSSSKEIITVPKEFDDQPQNSANNFPTVPMLNKSKTEIESTVDVPDGGLVYSLVDETLFINK